MTPSTEPVLLPPSSFESSHQTVDAWTALAQATGEILDLKEQNIKLQLVYTDIIYSGQTPITEYATRTESC